MRIASTTMIAPDATRCWYILVVSPRPVRPTHPSAPHNSYIKDEQRHTNEPSFNVPDVRSRLVSARTNVSLAFCTFCLPAQVP